MTTLQELLGTRIRICIEKAGYRTVEAFAFEFGIGKSTLSDILNGKKSPTVSTLARWANALKIPMREFFEDRQLDDWVRETPPDYFHNRGKTPRATKKSRAARPAAAPKTASQAASKASKAAKTSRAPRATSRKRPD